MMIHRLKNSQLMIWPIANPYKPFNTPLNNAVCADSGSIIIPLCWQGMGVVPPKK